MFERFTNQARTVIIHAQEESRRLGHPFIGTEHLLLGLLDPAAGGSAAVLANAGLDASSVRDAVRRMVAQPRPALTAEDAEALTSIGIDLERVLGRIEQMLGENGLEPVSEPRRRGLFRRRRPIGGRIPLTARAKKVLELSLRESVALKSGHIASEHLLLALIREGRGVAAAVLKDQGIDLQNLRVATLRSLDRAA